MRRVVTWPSSNFTMACPVAAAGWAVPLAKAAAVGCKTISHFGVQVPDAGPDHFTKVAARDSLAFLATASATSWLP